MGNVLLKLIAMEWNGIRKSIATSFLWRMPHFFFYSKFVNVHNLPFDILCNFIRVLYLYKFQSRTLNNLLSSLSKHFFITLTCLNYFTRHYNTSDIAENKWWLYFFPPFSNVLKHTCFLRQFVCLKFRPFFLLWSAYQQ